MRGFITMRRVRICGAPLHIHWSAFVAAGIMCGTMLRQPMHAALAVLSYFGIIVLHEAGHALLAKKLGYRPISIYITFIHGLCEFEKPEELKERAMIAWGGVLAQAAIAVPLIVLNQTTPVASIPFVGIVISLLGYFNLFIALFNLVPVHGLDGYFAWRLIPLLLRERRQKSAAKKTASDIIRRFR